MRVLLVAVLLAGCAAHGATKDVTLSSTAMAAPQGSPSVRLVGPPTQVEANRTVNVTVEVVWEGASAVHSDDVGAHWSTTHHAEGSYAEYPGACRKQTGTAPGLFTVPCTIPTHGVVYLRAHARVPDGDHVDDVWGPEAVVEVR